jgi:hypothetical protein
MNSMVTTGDGRAPALVPLTLRALAVAPPVGGADPVVPAGGPSETW